MGDGKSTELARMKSEIDTSPKYQDFISLFYSAKTNNKEDVFEKIQNDIDVLYEAFPDKKIIIFFDGIDELDSSIRKKVIAFLKGINIGVKEDKKVSIVMGSRYSEFDKYSDEEVIAIHFNTINETDKKEFLNSRLRSL